MITANLATQYNRIHILEKNINSIIPHVDKLRIYLNPPYPKIPSFLKTSKIKYIIGKENIGANGKLFFLKNKNEIYFTVDDDFIYTKDFFKNSIKKLKENPNCLITIHGKEIIKRPVKKYIGGNNGYLRMYYASKDQDKDYIIHIGGTGVMCFHSNIMIDHSFSLRDKATNMVDPYVAYFAYKNNIKIICRAHKGLTSLKKQCPTKIVGMNRDYSKELDLINKINN